MLLVNNDETQLGLRGKDSTAGANYNTEFTVSYPPPFVKLFSQRELAMKDGDLTGEAGGKSFYDLRSEGNFWYQDNSPFAQPNCFSQSLKIDFCLS
jgi:hypothetical protein